MVRAVALQSSKAAILIVPSFKFCSDQDIDRSKLEIISRYSNSRVPGSLWLLTISELPSHHGKEQVPSMMWLQAPQICRPNRGGSTLRKPKKMEEAHNNKN